MDNNPLSRRAFMQLGFAAMGTAAAAPLAGTFAPHTTALRVGVLLPHAQFRPLLTANVLDGLRLGFAGTQYQAQFVTKQVRAGELDVADAAHTLLNSGVDVVVGMVSTHALDAVQDVFGAAGATFLQMTAGENIDTAVRPNIAVNTLQYTQSAAAAGAWAVQSFGGRGVMLASFYESGFDTLYAAEQGIAAAGGTVVASVITHTRPTADRLADAIAVVHDTRPDFIYAAYNSVQAAAFMAAYRAAGLETPLVVSPFMLDDIGFQGEGLHSVGAWSNDIDSAENRDFLAAFGSVAGRRADAFALLGYETASWITAGLAAAGTPSGLLGGLAAARIASPRNGLAYDARQQTLSSTLVRHSIGAFSATIAPVETVIARAPEMKSGWVTPYLTV